MKRNLDPSLVAQEQFQKEAKLLAGLKHPNLPRVSHHFVVATGEQYLVMDYIAGENLDSLMRRRGKLPPREVFRYAYQVCDALTYLHSQMPPIIHRDIKPANIIITCLLYTSDAADERSSVDLGGRRIIKKKKYKNE